MIYLSNSAIQYAVNLCQEFEGFRAIIVSNDSDVRKTVIDKLKQLVLPDYDGPQNRFVDNTCVVQFPNYSTLKVIGMAENAIGSRAHLVVVDINIDRRTVDEVLRKLETLPYKPRKESDAWYMIP